jgi:hypothetical protein
MKTSYFRLLNDSDVFDFFSIMKIFKHVQKYRIVLFNRN